MVQILRDLTYLRLGPIHIWQKLEDLLVSLMCTVLVSFRDVDYDLDSPASCGLDRKKSKNVRPRVQEAISLILI